MISDIFSIKSQENNLNSVFLCYFIVFKAESVRCQKWIWGKKKADKQ